jgi:hypothetical protein
LERGLSPGREGSGVGKWLGGVAPQRRESILFSLIAAWLKQAFLDINN